MSLPQRIRAGRTPQQRQYAAGSCVCAWTPEEDAILQQLYEDGGSPACEPFLPGRSRVAIHRRAQRLGLVNGFKRPSVLTAFQLDQITAMITGKLQITRAELAKRVGLSDVALGKQITRQRRLHARRSALAASVANRFVEHTQENDVAIA